MVLEESTIIRARVHGNEDWSPLAELLVHRNGVPASDANVVVSEIMYHPPGEDEEDHEFLELWNPSDETGNRQLPRMAWKWKSTTA